MHSFTPDQRREFAADIDGRYAANTKKTIVLVGLMGSGKTALGKRLAVALERPFIDSDHLIEDQAGLSIRDIFELSGEAKFRDCLLYTSPSPRDQRGSRMPSSA